MRKNLSKKLKKLPKKPGVYIFFARGESALGGKDKTGRILYVGKAVNLKNRVRSHFASLNNSPQPPLILRGGIEKIADIDWIKTDNEKQALLLENELIKKYQPRYNIQWRDDKSYFWVMFTDEEWPRVKIVHQTKLKNPPQPSLKGGRTSPPLGGVRGDFSGIGPFVNGRELRQLLRALRKIFPYRTCKNPYEKPCLQWHLGLCPAHNPNSKLKAQSSKLLKKYLNSLNVLAQFLCLYAGEPIRTEAYDISNIHGVWATGSMIVFYGDKPQKSDYRRFKIKTVCGANDVAMIKEVIRRRFGHPEWPTPDLILIDGGRAQLNAVIQTSNTFFSSPPQMRRGAKGEELKLYQHPTPALPSSEGRELNVPAIIALAKLEEKIYTEYSDKTLKLSALPLSLRLTFQAIRNEAHRFAIFYYRHLHEKQYKRGTATTKIGRKIQKKTKEETP